MFLNYDRNMETLIEMFDEIAHPHKKRHTHMGFFSDELIQMDLATQNAHLTSKIDDLEKELVSLRKLLSGTS